MMLLTTAPPSPPLHGRGLLHPGGDVRWQRREIHPTRCHLGKVKLLMMEIETRYVSVGILMVDEVSTKQD